MSKQCNDVETAFFFQLCKKDVQGPGLNNNTFQIRYELNKLKYLLVSDIEK